MKLKKFFPMAGLGAGTGVIQVLLTKNYDQVIVPGIPSPWGNLSVLPNIVIGGVILGLVFTDKLGRYGKLEDFLIPYGFSVFIGGLVNAVLTPSMGFRQVRSSNLGYGPAPYMGEHVGFQPHRAKGFGSPFASPASTIPYNVINY